MNSEGLIPKAEQPLTFSARHAVRDRSPFPFTLSPGGVGISDDRDDEPREKNEVGGDQERDNASSHARIV